MLMKVLDSESNHGDVHALGTLSAEFLRDRPSGLRYGRSLRLREFA
jgi:hypothetical protein